MPEPAPAHFPIKHAAVRLAVGRSTVYRFINEGRLRKIKVGYKTLIPVVDVEQLIQALQGGTLKLGKRGQREGEAAKNAAHKERMRARRAEAKAAKRQHP
jgi:excisionase family DNA binding protein